LNPRSIAGYGRNQFLLQATLATHVLRNCCYTTEDGQKHQQDWMIIFSLSLRFDYSTYTSRGHGCGIYKLLIFVDSKVLKQAHSKLRNCFSTAAIGKNSAVRNPQS